VASLKAALYRASYSSLNFFASSLASLACFGDLRERLLPELLDVIVVLVIPQEQLVVVAMVMGDMFHEVPITSLPSSSMSITIPILCSSTLLIRLLYGVPFFVAACCTQGEQSVLCGSFPCN
jgi:hypothetical protein